jgi:hypothetical protein
MSLNLASNLESSSPEDDNNNDNPALFLTPPHEKSVLSVDESDLECNNVWGIYTNKKTGLAAAYQPNDYANKIGLTRTPDGLLIAGEHVVAYQNSTTLSILPTIEAPNADGRELFLKTLSDIMTRLNMYSFQSTFHQLRGKEFVGIDNQHAFDSWIARSMIVWSIVPDKEGNRKVKLVQLAERTVKQLFRDPQLKQLLPQVDVINEVQQPYFVNGTLNKVVFHPVGYNPDTRTMTLGVCDAKSTSKKATDRWFKNLIKDYEFQKPEVDIPAILCQMLGTYGSDLFYDFQKDGKRGEKYITPIVMVDSNATGSGKTMMMKMMSLPALGVVNETIADKPEEIEKIMTSKIRQGEKYLYLDEAERVVSKSLLTVVTGRHEGRVLSKSETVSGDLLLMLSGCNIEFNEMLARRVVCCKLWTSQDPDKKKLSRVIEKGDFTRLRPLMLTYARNMILEWVKKGCPLGSSNNNWNRFSRVIGGILIANGYKEPWNERAGSAILPGESADAQLPDFVRKLEDGILSIGTKHWTDVEIQMPELRSLLQNAGYYEWIREDLSGIRKLGKCIKPWVNSPRQIIPGIYLRSRHTMQGKAVWFTTDPQSKPKHKLVSGRAELIEKNERMHD